MARRNSDGKYILSAGEIGTYTVCPESWRLRVIEKIKTSKSSDSELGEKLHKEWANQFEEALFFNRGTRILVCLAAIAIVLALINRL